MPENIRSSSGNPWVASKLVWIAEQLLRCRAPQAVLCTPQQLECACRSVVSPEPTGGVLKKTSF